MGVKHEPLKNFAVSLPNLICVCANGPCAGLLWCDDGGGGRASTVSLPEDIVRLKESLTPGHGRCNFEPGDSQADSVCI